MLQTLMNICCAHAAPTSCYYSNDERLVYDIMPLSQYALYHFTTWLSIMGAICIILMCHFRGPLALQCYFIVCDEIHYKTCHYI